MNRSRAAVLCVALAFTLAGCQATQSLITSGEARAANWLASHRSEQPLVRAFVQRLPKGAELHTHLSGAVYAESYIQWAAEAGFYVEPKTGKILPPEARQDGLRPLSEIVKDPAAYSALIDRISTRNLEHSGQPGHAQFFKAFGRFRAVARRRVADMLARVVCRAAEQRVQHVEVMLTLRSKSMEADRELPPWDGDFEKALEWVEKRGLQRWVQEARAGLDATLGSLRARLGCDAGAAPQACSPSIRFIQQNYRVHAPASLFKYMAYAFELAKQDARVVGINLVAPEDDRVALRDYTLQMNMIRFLGRRSPEVKIALHAGELTLGLVPPADLRFHIAEAVDIAGARRIGHGVSLFYEREPFSLLERMRSAGTAVEVCLTNNEITLGVAGRDHPLPAYLDAGIPVVLCSDDEGVSRIDLSHEYHRAVRDYDLGYEELKRLSRNGLEFSFLPGRSLWIDSQYSAMVPACVQDDPSSGAMSDACRVFLAGSERARAQWQLEREFAEFERLPWLK